MRSRWFAAFAIVCLTAALYAYRFGASPPYIGGDEAHFAVQAYALAHNGRSLKRPYARLR
jgi:hypothetical protein